MELREDALFASYRRLETPLYNVLYRILWQREDCQDVIQDAYARIWQRRSRVDPQTLDNLAWTTALNLARNRLRWRSIRHFVELPTSQASAAPLPEQEIAAQQVRHAIDQLPAKLRDVLLLAEFSGMKHRQIASVLAIPAGTVASRRHNAIGRLKRLLGEDSDE